MSANDKQVGGDHYRVGAGEQHWDRVARLGLNYWQGNATSYIERALLKGNAVQDLEKAAHYCMKLVELIQAGIVKPVNTTDPAYRSPAETRTHETFRVQGGARGLTPKRIGDTE